MKVKKACGAVRVYAFFALVLDAYNAYLLITVRLIQREQKPIFLEYRNAWTPEFV
jgi:hypothetical protein